MGDKIAGSDKVNGDRYLAFAVGQLCLVQFVDCIYSILEHFGTLKCLFLFLLFCLTVTISSSNFFASTPLS